MSSQNVKPSGGSCGCGNFQTEPKEPTITEESRAEKPAPRSKSCGICKPESKPPVDESKIIEDQEIDYDVERIKSISKSQASAKSSSKPDVKSKSKVLIEDEALKSMSAVKSAKSSSKPGVTTSEAFDDECIDDDKCIDEPTPTKSTSKAKTSAAKIASSGRVSSCPEIADEERIQRKGIKSCQCPTNVQTRSKIIEESEKGDVKVDEVKLEEVKATKEHKRKEKRKACSCGQASNRNAAVEDDDGTIKIKNPNLANMDEDVLYHLALGTCSHNLEAMFGDVKFVCMASKPKCVEKIANCIMEETCYNLQTGTQLTDISVLSYRYSIYKVGPVLCVSHGMGSPSIGILLNELIKLLYYSKAKDVVFFRIGVCGGIGIEPGTVVITEEALDGSMNNYYETKILGKSVQRPTTLDRKLIQEIKSLTKEDDDFQTVRGKTMCTDDFYEGQGRMDGVFCDYTDEEKMEYFNKLKSNGVINVEMESLAFAAITNYAGIRAAILTVSIIDRLKEDKVSVPEDTLRDIRSRPRKLVVRYINKYSGNEENNEDNPMERQQSVNVKSQSALKEVQQASENIET